MCIQWSWVLYVGRRWCRRNRNWKRWAQWHAQSCIQRTHSDKTILCRIAVCATTCVYTSLSFWLQCHDAHGRRPSKQLCTSTDILIKHDQTKPKIAACISFMCLCYITPSKCKGVEQAECQALSAAKLNTYSFRCEIDFLPVLCRISLGLSPQPTLEQNLTLHPNSSEAATVKAALLDQDISQQFATHHWHAAECRRMPKESKLAPKVPDCEQSQKPIGIPTIDYFYLLYMITPI